MGSNYDLSCYSRDGCIVDYAKLPLQTAWGRATLNPTAVAESKVLYEPVWVKGEPLIAPVGMDWLDKEVLVADPRAGEVFAIDTTGQARALSNKKR